VTPKVPFVLEKPLGQDRASAEAINRSVGAIFGEQQIFFTFLLSITIWARKRSRT